MAELKWSNVDGSNLNTASSLLINTNNQMYDRTSDLTKVLQGHLGTMQQGITDNYEFERNQNTDRIINQMNSAESQEDINRLKLLGLTDGNRLDARFGNRVDLSKVNQAQASWVADTKGRADAKDNIKDYTDVAVKRRSEISTLINQGKTNEAMQLLNDSVDIFSKATVDSMHASISDKINSDRNYALESQYKKTLTESSQLNNIKIKSEFLKEVEQNKAKLAEVTTATRDAIINAFSRLGVIEAGNAEQLAKYQKMPDKELYAKAEKVGNLDDTTKSLIDTARTAWANYDGSLSTYNKLFGNNGGGNDGDLEKRVKTVEESKSTTANSSQKKSKQEPEQEQKEVTKDENNQEATTDNDTTGSTDTTEATQVQKELNNTAQEEAKDEVKEKVEQTEQATNTNTTEPVTESVDEPKEDGDRGEPISGSARIARGEVDLNTFTKDTAPPYSHVKEELDKEVKSIQARLGDKDAELYRKDMQKKLIDSNLWEGKDIKADAIAIRTEEINSGKAIANLNDEKDFKIVKDSINKYEQDTKNHFEETKTGSFTANIFNKEEAKKVFEGFMERKDIKDIYPPLMVNGKADPNWKAKKEYIDGIGKALEKNPNLTYTDGKDNLSMPNLLKQLEDIFKDGVTKTAWTVMTDKIPVGMHNATTNEILQGVAVKPPPTDGKSVQLSISVDKTISNTEVPYTTVADYVDTIVNIDESVRDTASEWIGLDFGDDYKDWLKDVNKIKATHPAKAKMLIQAFHQQIEPLLVQAMKLSTSSADESKFKLLREKKNNLMEGFNYLLKSTDESDWKTFRTQSDDMNSYIKNGLSPASLLSHLSHSGNAGENKEAMKLEQYMYSEKSNLNRTNDKAEIISRKYPKLYEQATQNMRRAEELISDISTARGENFLRDNTDNLVDGTDMYFKMQRVKALANESHEARVKLQEHFTTKEGKRDLELLKQTREQIKQLQKLGAGDDTHKELLKKLDIILGTDEELGILPKILEIQQNL